MSKPIACRGALPPLPPQRLAAFQRWLREYWERDVTLPAEYVAQLLAYHGGTPSKRFFKAGRKQRELGQFFHLALSRELPPPHKPSWRSWGHSRDGRRDYRLREFHDNEFWGVRLEDAEALLPIAAVQARLDYREMEEFDLLCLDYSTSDDAPTVVIWETPGFGELKKVAPSFAGFLQKCQRAA